MEAVAAPCPPKSAWEREKRVGEGGGKRVGEGSEMGKRR